MLSKIECSVTGCDKPSYSKSWCQKHYTRWYRHGSPLLKFQGGPPKGSPGNFYKDNNVSCKAVHNRLKKEHGLASTYECEHCDAMALDWAYNNACEYEKEDKYGKYCVHPEHYIPLCRSCHKLFDLNFFLTRWAVQETYSLNETCETWDHSCPARQLWLVDAEQKRLQGILPVVPKVQVVDEKGFRTCNFCGRPARGQLKQCPECGRFFKGTKPYKPRKIDYECEACE